ncbi:RloB family protein [Actinacidiphila yeochonensis]|uniref:RloB family protein n=1 Tax=Actinacidiphila yeochonensis TaxID=89050 RepID=UPI00068F2E89|nr:RloB family protein [Actinacidiphila yeochonensis]
MRLEAACDRARALGIGVAISSPCFEIWLLWHYEDWARWSDARSLLDRLKSRHGFTGKNLPRSFPYADYQHAVRRAERCGPAEPVHAPPNPHSTICVLASGLVRDLDRGRDQGLDRGRGPGRDPGPG